MSYAAIAPLRAAATRTAKAKAPVRSAAPLPPASTAPASTPAASEMPNPYDYSTDPVLAQITGLANTNVANAEAAALAARKRAEIDYGFDPSFKYEDTATADAAKANPFSILANLSHGHDVRAHNLDENLNKANLFYSGYRGSQLGEEGRTYLGEKSAAAGNLGSTLTGIAGNLLGAKETANTNIGSANTDAYNRALTFATSYPAAFSAPSAVAASNRKPALRAGTILGNIGSRRY